MKFKAIVGLHPKLRYNTDQVEKYLLKFKAGTVLDMELKRARKSRSEPQQAYYWANVLPTLGDHLGYDRGPEQERLHDWLKCLYFNIQPDSRGIYKGIPSVWGKESKLDVKERSEFVDYVIRLAAKEGVVINEPN